MSGSVPTCVGCLSLRPSNTDLRIKVPLASVLAELLICTLAGKLCRLSVNSIPELIRCHLDDSVLEQDVIFRQYRHMVENPHTRFVFSGPVGKMAYPPVLRIPW